MSIKKDKQRQVETQKNKSDRIRKKVDKKKIEDGYAAFAKIIGIADFDPTDASVNHDDVIYELQSKK